jgi:uncharacterized protein YyaL (SSP411 family)
MFLAPDDRRPFFGGTYFPKDAKYGMPAFTELLASVARYFDEQRDAIRQQGERLVDIFERLDPPALDGNATLTDEPLHGFRQRVGESFDRDYGGTGDAPKFPHAATIAVLLRRWRASAHSGEPDLDALYMATLTLTRMAEGGLFDHVGGGFYRYSVDRAWQIPHFEKMLCDNGPLLAVYAEAALATGDPLFANAAERTAAWILKTLGAGNGGFFSTLDADSEGEEGRYYVWTPEQVDAALDADGAALVKARFGLEQPPNFEGRWHLAAQRDIEDVAKAAGLSVEKAADAIASALAVLETVRMTRVPPDIDDKQLTSWNALAMRGLAIAGRSLDRRDLVGAAGATARFLRDEMLENGRLFASHKDGRARFNGYLDDYAFTLDALLELLQVSWSSESLAFATTLADSLLDHFEDADAGGFFFTSHDHETLLHRSKPMADEALPSGNGVAVFALQRLGLLLGEPRYLDAADRGLRVAWQAMKDYPHGHATLLNALDDALDPPETIIIRGEATEAANWRDSAHRVFAPKRQIFAIPADAADLPPGLADKQAVDGETVAYRCVGMHCEAPVTSFEALAQSLREF